MIVSSTSLRTLAFVVAAAAGFAALAALDAWRPSTSWIRRLDIWLVGFAAARALGIFAGAPLRRGTTKTVTRRGLLSALPVALAVQVLGWSLLWVLIAPAIFDEPPRWRDDLILSGVILATLPLYLLSIRIAARPE